MKLVALIENETCREDLQAEHGLSLYIEACGHKILFDAGESGAFADNGEKLGVDLKKVDMAVLSHGHSDHGGGLLRFLSVNDTAPVYLQKAALEGHYNAQNDDIGLDDALMGEPRLRFAGERQTIGEGLTLIAGSCLPEKQPIDSAGLTVLRGGVYCPDPFLHEQYLLIEEAGKRVLISGCSHRGILNIADHFRPDVLIGGFHFFKQQADSPMVIGAANKLLEYPTVYYTGHCTGVEQYAAMKKIMADRLHYLSTGTVLEL